MDNREPFQHNDDYIRIRDLVRLAAEFQDSAKVDTTVPFAQTYSQVKNSFQSEIVIAAYIRRYIDDFDHLVDEFNDHVQVFNTFTEYVENTFGDIYNNILEINGAINDLSGRIDDHDTQLEQLRQAAGDLENAILQAMTKEVVSAEYDKTTQYLTLTKADGSTITTTIPQFDDTVLIGLIDRLNAQINDILDQIAEINNNMNGSTTLEGEVNSVGGQLQAIGIDVNMLSYGGTMVYNKLNGGNR